MTPSNLYLDYSQFDSFMKCEYFWWESYRMQFRKAPKEGQTSDARTLGSLVHAGLENFRKNGTPAIPESSVAEFGPTPETLAEGTRLVHGYVATYPNEQFTKYYCEEPLRFPLLPGRMDGLAKIDSYFNIAESVSLESGLGDQFSLDPGWWIHEYKTKAASKDIGKYLGSWRMNMQACFQMLAAQQITGEMPRGVLVNVIEKAPEYFPVRSCRACKERVELRDWRPTGTGYMCPQCGNIQDIDTSDKSKTARVPRYYRIMVQRTLDELERARTDMVSVAERILTMDRNYGLTGDPGALRRTSSCVDQIWGNCDYFLPHSLGVSAAGFDGFVPVDALHYVTR